MISSMFLYPYNNLLMTPHLIKQNEKIIYYLFNKNKIGGVCYVKQK